MTFENERVRYIKTGKPEQERALRLRLFQPVQGSLPASAAEAWRASDAAITALHASE